MAKPSLMECLDTFMAQADTLLDGVVEGLALSARGAVGLSAVGFDSHQLRPLVEAVLADRAAVKERFKKTLHKGMYEGPGVDPGQGRAVTFEELKFFEEDQLDWLKLPGITFTPWFTHGNTAMVGWRYNMQKDSFELNTYFHQRGGTFFKDNPHLCVAPNETFETEIKLDYATKGITTSIITPRGTLSETRRYHFKRFQSWAVFIHPFFGGTTKAPHRVVLYAELIKKVKFKGKR